MFTNLKELIQSMPTEQVCREYLAKIRWNDGKPKCPFCGWDKCYVIEGGKKYKCANNTCYKKFSVTVGTIFEASNIPLSKWFMAVYLVSAHKKGISSYQLAKDIGIAQKSAWFMLHRIREMMREKTNNKMYNTVEVDECYIGGSVKNMNKSKRKKLKESGDRWNKKEMVMGILERNGMLRLINIGDDNNVGEFQTTIKNNVHPDSSIVTDSHAGYVGLNKIFNRHEVVNHKADEYVNAQGFNTNSIEGAFSHFKRSIYGIYHFCTAKHLSAYCDETAFRYNFRGMTDAERFNWALEQVEGRLTYKKLVAKPVRKESTLAPNNEVTKGRQGVRKPIYQLQDGLVIDTFPTIAAAARKSGIDKTSIGLVLRGKQRNAGGFQWKYVP